MKKQAFLFLSSLPLCLSLSGCSVFSDYESEYEDEVTLTEASYPLYNYNGEYAIKASSLKTYFVDGGALPYVDVSSFIDSLEGLYQTKYISYSTTSSRKLIASWRSQSATYTLTVDDEANTIKVNSATFFNLLYGTSGTNYSFAMKTVEAKLTQDSPKTFDLGSYGIEIYRKKSLVLIPFCLANTIF